MLNETIGAFPLIVHRPPVRCGHIKLILSGPYIVILIIEENNNL